MNGPHFLQRDEIDTNLWDACVERHSNGVIYFNSWYLDALCPNWSALVWGHYQAVMPLPWRKKWGLKYVYQPAFLQRLGVAGNASLTDGLRYAQKNFRFVHYNVNDLAATADFVTKNCNNFILPLAHSYAVIQKNYTQECIRNIKKAQQRGCFLKTAASEKNVITAYRNTYGSINPRLKNEDYDRLHRLFVTAAHNGHIQLYEMIDATGDELFQGALLQDNKRLYYLLGAPTTKGRQKRATYFFIDQMLQQHAGGKKLFDFEGSDLPNVAHFYQSFGPQVETYSTVRITPFTRM